MNSSSFINLYVLPAERRLRANTGVRERAQALGLARIVAHTDQAIAHDQQILQMDIERAVEQATAGVLFTPETRAVDRRMDRAISGFDRYLASQMRIHEADTQPGRAARAVRALVFPDGARAITSLPYERQYEVVAARLARLGQPDMQAQLASLADAAAIIARIAALNVTYGQSLEKPQVGPSREELRAANARGRDLLAETVALIIAEFAGTQGDPRFAQLMQPIVKQNAAMRGRYRRRAGSAEQPEADQAEELPEDSAGELPEDSAGEAADTE